MGNELLDLQRLTLGRVAHQLDSFLWAVSDAHPAAHAGRSIDAGKAIIHRDRCKLARVDACAAAGTHVGVHARKSLGRCQDGLESNVDPDDIEHHSHN
jgi:hypothetical protein